MNSLAPPPLTRTSCGSRGPDVGLKGESGIEPEDRVTGLGQSESM